MKKVNPLQVLLIVFILSTLIIPLSLLTTVKEKFDQPIIIRNDDDFLKYNFSGNGSESNPYIIENIIMKNEEDYNSAEFYSGIIIGHTTKYFIIRNCTILNYWTGIAIKSVKQYTARVCNNTIDSSAHVVNGMKHADYGIVCDSSSGTVIDNNLVINGFDLGIVVYRSFNSTVYNNTVCNVIEGIYLLSSDYVKLTENNCSLNGQGIHSVMSDNLILDKNFIVGNVVEGLSIADSKFLVIVNNTIDYTKTSYLTNSTIEGNSIIFYSLTMVQSENNTIRYNVFSNYGERSIIYMYHSNSNVIHHNAFMVIHQLYTSDAKEYECYNLWYETLTSEGNYWHGWNTSLPYPIAGGSSEDLYPLEENPVV